MKYRWFGFLILMSVAFYLEAASAPVILNAGYFQNPPELNGRIQEKEWQNATATSGFYSYREGREVDNRKCTFLAGYDSKYLYLAIQSELPPDKRLATKAMTDGNAILSDDTVEIWIAPPSEGRDVKAFQFGYFQLMLNSNGKMLAMHHEPGYGLASHPWPVKVRNGSAVTNNSWCCELAIPWSDLGFSNPKLGGMKLGIMAARNFQVAPSSQSSLSPTGVFNDTSSYAKLTLSVADKRVRVGYGANELPLSVQTFSNAIAELSIQGKTKQIPLPAGKTVDLSDEISFAAFPVKFELAVKGNNGELYYQRGGVLDPARPKWTHLFSDLTLFHNFSKELRNADFSFIKHPRTMSKRIPRKVEGHAPGLSGIALTDELIYQRGHITIPGNISVFIKGDNLKDKFMLWGTEYSQLGYMGLQQHPGSMLFFMHNFPGIKVTTTGFGIRQSQGEWQHFSVNFHKDKIEFYLNGIMRHSILLEHPIDASKLGGLRLGTRQCVSQVAVFKRALTDSEIKMLANEGNSFNGKISWFPSLKSLAVEFTAAVNTPARPFTMELYQNSKKLRDFSIPGSRGMKLKGVPGLRSFHELVKVGDLPEGRCRLVLFTPDGTQLTEKEFQMKHYPWEHNSLGKKHLVLKPFTGVKVDGRTYDVVLRRYKLGKNGLPESITAMGCEILASPVKLIVEDASGKNAEWSNEQFIALTHSPDAASFRASASNALFDMNVEGRLEYDGLIRYDYKLATKGKELPRLAAIELPLKKEIAQLFHAAAAGTRNNPAGFLPNGEGIIWKSTEIPNFNFIPYCWVGEDFRGLAYVADSDEGWSLSEKHSAVELIRGSDGTVRIRLNILAEPQKHSGEYRFTIALMASPVKPQPEGFRGWADQATWGQKGTRHMISLLSPPYWGGYYSWLSRYPAFGNMGYLDKLDEARKTGKFDERFIKEWTSRVLDGVPNSNGWINEKTVSAHTRGAMHRMTELHKLGPESFYYIYTCNADSAKLLPEYPVYKDEWEYQSLTHMTESFADYSLYYIKQMLEHGVGGIYMDNTFFCRKYAWPTSDGYVDENGVIRASYGLWRSREYIRRLAVMMTEMGKEPYIVAHHTNANLLPVFSHVTNVMGMEWKYGSADFQERFTPDYIRAVNQGKQGGFFPTSLDGLKSKDAAERIHLTRTMLAMLLPHEIRPTASLGTDMRTYRKISDILFNFGIYRPDTEFFAYWNMKNPLKSQDKGFLASVYRRGNTLLLVGGDYASRPEKIKLKSTLPLKSARDLESGVSLKTTINEIELPYRKHDVQLVEVRLME